MHHLHLVSDYEEKQENSKTHVKNHGFMGIGSFQRSKILNYYTSVFLFFTRTQSAFVLGISPGNVLEGEGKLVISQVWGGLATPKILSLDTESRSSEGSTYRLQSCSTLYCKSVAGSLEIPDTWMSPRFLGACKSTKVLRQSS